MFRFGITGLISSNMSKLPPHSRFLDLSDYGRPLARYISHALKKSTITPIHITIAFIISGLMAIVCIVNELYWMAALFLVIKSILDAADGELARVKNTPSYTGRYFDSVADIILNFLVLITIGYLTEAGVIMVLLSFIGIQLQGTLYNYYYVILRNRFEGDTTSRIFEDGIPTALKGEKQKHVNVLFRMYKMLYTPFDKAIYWADMSAIKAMNFPNWLMTIISTFGLGFSLLLIGIMLVLGWIEYIIPFFIVYTFFIPVYIGIRRFINTEVV